MCKKLLFQRYEQFWDSIFDGVAHFIKFRQSRTLVSFLLLFLFSLKAKTTIFCENTLFDETVLLLNREE